MTPTKAERDEMRRRADIAARDFGSNHDEAGSAASDSAADVPALLDALDSLDEMGRERDATLAELKQARETIATLVNAPASVPTGDGWSECHYCEASIDDGADHRDDCAWKTAQSYMVNVMSSERWDAVSGRWTPAT